LKTRGISRRFFLAAAGAALAAPRVWAEAQERTPTLLDHILLGSASLEAGIAFVEQRTRNALLSLGRSRYLEIIAPDPQQPASADARDLASLEQPVLVGWAAHPGDIQEFAARLREKGVAATGPNPGQRKRPDGRVLHWKTLTLKDDAGGLLPFFIEWGADSLHPSADAPQGCRLTVFEAATPFPGVLLKQIEQLQIDLPITQAKTPHLHAVITGPQGQLDVTF
jgi:hypothetical protein